MKFSLHTLCSCISLALALLLLSVTVEGQPSTDPKLTLRDLFEGALLNSSESLNTLQNVFFNPSNIRSPESVCIEVTVTVDNINNIQKGQEDYCYVGAAFHCDDSSFPWSEAECSSGWYFTSFYELKLADGEKSGISQLSDLLTYSRNTGMFFVFDPSFYTIMEALSVSLDDTFSFGNIPNMDDQALPSSSIAIHISEDLQQMPCRS